jgi:signal transduction histidine kinase
LLASARNLLAYAFYAKGDYSGALDMALLALSYFETSKNTVMLTNTYNLVGIVYMGQENYPKAKIYFRDCLQTATAVKDTANMSYATLNLADVYDRTNILDSALYYIPKAITYIHANHDDYLADILDIQGEVYLKLKNYNKAINYLQRSYSVSQNKHNILSQSVTCVSLSRFYRMVNNVDSAIYWAKKGLAGGRSTSSNETIYQSADLLWALYESNHQTDSAFKYLKISSIAKESLYSTAKFQAIDALNSGEERRNAEIANARTVYQTNLKIYLLLFVIAIVLIAAILLWRNSRTRQKAFDLVKEQKKQTDIQKDAAEQALHQLKATQTQLIQSEKMASLGELTAGIAHEIQNPLNFVNNFSEVSIELLDELQAEAQAGHTNDVIAIATDLTQNLEKINHHGKRADAIVKGMLEHSRASTGQKESTDINTLADEYLRLAYHGLRAKDKNFNAELVTHFDTDLPKVIVIQQDIGRVLLNLFNNAFYAVNQKQKTARGEYKPEVSVSTSSENEHVIISVKDNGTGIPDAIKDKIMQPFFTTKATGEGTGLGLSLSYDIVVKGHGGKIDFESEDGVGSTFTITLPA